MLLAAGICIEPFKFEASFAAFWNWQHMVVKHRKRICLVLYDRCKNKCLDERELAFLLISFSEMSIYPEMKCLWICLLATISCLIRREILISVYVPIHNVGKKDCWYNSCKKLVVIQRSVFAAKLSKGISKHPCSQMH